eukprot:CAMPEP_0196763246 /NCGR_PEP_ID=MMETSP1095-20130614/3683_1 /TAXON_ID=96789 ORGANISM="Chromulina nebulosa, Strain UTEXLB2642" /NCGR_SAMPLE_ID=MMETSP1095 /ASSEMBLY_ACC=CAM_ASM_000446 /LENGTH=356 /DNA_ID=CAMNT_0042116007 /DNA_START=137 /DNA_END=1207 /DNA_ORIENTATION=+
MGCMLSSSATVKPLKNEVDKQLEEAQELEKYIYKILLLGAGESGKSTVVKQIKMLYKVGGGPSAREIQEYILAIRRNVLEAIQILIEASKTLGVDIQNKDLINDSEKILLLDTNVDLTPELAQRIHNLWIDEGIQQVFSRRNEYWNMDALPYYLNEVLRLGSDDYEPSEEDMVMTRVRTTGIVVTEVLEPPYTYNVVDVGGQRSERRKWIHCFDDVKAIIFLEGLAGYNQVLFEDNSVNRMQESLNLFAEVAKNPIFKNTPIFVFLNKKDLFEEMIPKYPLSICFPEYKGKDGDVQEALKYIEAKYKAIMEECVPGKVVYVHVIAARLRMDMKIAFGEVREQLKKLYPVNGKIKKN